ncbi:homocysteine S-methyltransferase family protein [Thalassobius sp. MITS945101]|uniref:homocysteine S-methyltransferase family protein n=1 Tax=Thalassobius sp. MITS945101 TaxID=3096994 RepID=UPI003999EF76
MAQITLLDGGMSRELVACGAELKQPEWSAGAVIDRPEAVVAAHRNFINAGAEVITVNAYAMVPFHIGEDRFSSLGAEWTTRAAGLAREAAGTQAKVAGCLPPLFGSYKPELFDTARAPTMLKQLIEAQFDHVDLWLVETTSSLEEAAAAAAALAGDSRPLWIAFTLQDDAPTQPLLRSGETVLAATELALHHGAEALLFNCSQPEAMGDAVAIAADTARAAGSTMRIGVYANAFDEHKDEGAGAANEVITEVREDLTPAAYLDWADQWIAAGASIIGGCCGVGSAHIAALRQHLKDV